jgi:hypothetical protein
MRYVCRSVVFVNCGVGRKTRIALRHAKGSIQYICETKMKIHVSREDDFEGAGKDEKPVLKKRSLKL